MRNRKKYDYLKAAGRGVLLSFLLFVFYLPAQSQSYVGFEVGGTRSYISVDKEFRKYIIPTNFVELGVKYQKPINNNFDFSIELDFTTRGTQKKGEIYETWGSDPNNYSFKREKVDVTVSFKYLNAPVVLSYALIKNPKIKINSGIYLSYLIQASGSTYFLYEEGPSHNLPPTYKIEVDAPTKKLDNYFSFDVGTVHGIGYEIMMKNQNILYADLSFQLGLMHISPKLPGRKNRAYVLNIGVLFDTNKAKTQIKNLIKGRKRVDKEIGDPIYDY
jgi:hypothetical protein